MDIILKFIDFIMNVDKHLTEMINAYGALTYLILFLIVFCETGLVVTPFLPGDSMIFVIGALAASGELHTAWIYIILCGAAILGDTVNYHIGKFVGPKIFQQDKVKFLKKDYLIRTHQFYEKYGGKTIIIARFVPIIRTFAPFVAGIGSMSYFKFLIYNIFGGILWVTLFIAAGYFFGNIPFVERNFTIVIFAIILISLVPGVIGYLSERRKIKAK